jgi:hypothetical protein
MKSFVKTAFILLALIFDQAWGTKFINFEKPGYQIDTVYFDDIFISGFKVKFDSKVYGDLFSFSYEIVQTDSIDGNFMAFARSVQNLGTVTGSFRAFGQKLSCNSDVGRNLLLGGQEINVGPAAKIYRDADLGGKTVVFQGVIDGNLKIGGRIAVVSGTIGGNLEFSGDSLTINPNTVINGDVNYDSPARAAISDAATINGQVNWKKTEVEAEDTKKGGGFWSAITWIGSARGFLAWNIFSSLVALVFILLPFPGWLVFVTFWVIMVASGNILLVITRTKAFATEGVLGRRFFPSMGLGFIIFFLTPVIAIVLFFTILLGPLALALSMLFGIAVFAGGIYACLYVGRRVCMLFSAGAKNSSGYLCYTIGMTALLILSIIPILGYLMILAALMTGVGGLAQTFWRPKAEAATAGFQA